MDGIKAILLALADSPLSDDPILTSALKKHAALMAACSVVKESFEDNTLSVAMLRILIDRFDAFMGDSQYMEIKN